MARYAANMLRAGIAVVVICVSGCVTVPRKPPAEVPIETAVPGGVYHTVAKGQTLWRIARMYGTDVDGIADANKIQDAAQIEVGQRLLIPGAAAVQASFSGVPGEDFFWPVNGAVVSGFGQASASGRNKGLNIKPQRDAGVKAARSGTVVFCNNDFLDLGRTVIIDHGDGFLTVYAGDMNLSVKPGDVVTRGDAIGQAGTGDIHFEIRKGAVSQNPIFYLSC